jgi:hypothetical protein
MSKREMPFSRRVAGEGGESGARRRGNDPSRTVFLGDLGEPIE